MRCASGLSAKPASVMISHFNYKVCNVFVTSQAWREAKSKHGSDVSLHGVGKDAFL